MIYCCNMIICILLTFISSVQMVDYDDGNPWWDHLLDNQPDADPNRRILWTHLGDSQHHCNEPKASSCSYIRINMNILVHQNWFYLPEEPFPHGNLVKCGRLKSFKNLYDENFSTEYRQPCVMFAGKDKVH